MWLNKDSGAARSFHDIIIKARATQNKTANFCVIEITG
jgi:hypothetical protein